MAENLHPLVEQLRLLLNNPLIGAEGNNDTLVAVRTAIPAVNYTANQTAIRVAYGCASNAAFMNATFKEDPLMRQFCVYNCAAGVFQGNFDAITVPKMVQLLTYARMNLCGMIQPETREPFAMYQSYAMAELFGPYIPADRRLPTNECQMAIRQAVYWLLRNVPDTVEDDWYHPAIGLGENLAAALAITIAEMTIHQALAVLEAMSLFIPTRKEWLNAASLATSVITSLAKRGAITPAAILKITKGVSNDFPGIQVVMSTQTIKMFYNNFGRYVNEHNAEAIFTHYRAILPEGATRLTITIQQSADSGMTVFYVIKRCLQDNRDFPYWGLCASKFRQDFINFEAANAAVADNHYYGFRRDLQNVAASKFRSLGFLCQQLLIRISGDGALERYKGLSGNIPHEEWITELVERYNQDNQQADFNRRLDAAEVEYINQFMENLDAAA